jgi:CYTH domain-containing protein
MMTIARGSRFERPEWERRFLLSRFPADVVITDVRQITDRYLDGTTLRLRKMIGSEGSVAFKLTQKRSHHAAGAFQGKLTTIYLTEEEYNVLAALPAHAVEKTRYSVPPFGIDVFTGNLAGLILAEAEFRSAEEAAALMLPPFLAHEITSDPRFTGGALSLTTREGLIADLEEFGIVVALE